ncbi:MAG: alpha/beta hydrolase [Anaerolineae bacterium]|nr:alpha/beta hydrolase [Anaerolineae bacterium]
MKRWLLVGCLLALLIASTALAQDATPTPQGVEITAADELVLKGDFFATSESDGEKPAVLLLHMLDSSRAAWNPLIPALIADGYNVLAVDLRGHGKTGGSRDWAKAQDDTQAWLAWLREQPTVKDDAVSIIGASVGTTLALVGCATDESCVTAIALSPVTWPSIPSQEALSDGLKDRSALLIASHADRGSADTLRALVASATGELGTRLFAGGAHGTAYLSKRNKAFEPVMNMILDWLDEHQPAAESE